MDAIIINRHRHCCHDHDFHEGHQDYHEAHHEGPHYDKDHDDKNHDEDPENIFVGWWQEEKAIAAATGRNHFPIHCPSSAAPGGAGGHQVVVSLSLGLGLPSSLSRWW